MQVGAGGEARGRDDVVVQAATRRQRKAGWVRPGTGWQQRQQQCRCYCSRWRQARHPLPRRRPPGSRPCAPSRRPTPARTTRSPLLCQRCTPLAASGPRSPASACRWGCQTTASTWSRAGASGRSRAPLRAAAAVRVRPLGMQVRLGAPAGAQERGPPLMARHALPLAPAGPGSPPTVLTHHPAAVAARRAPPRPWLLLLLLLGCECWAAGGLAGGVATCKRPIEQCKTRSAGPGLGGTCSAVPAQCRRWPSLCAFGSQPQHAAALHALQSALSGRRDAPGACRVAGGRAAAGRRSRKIKRRAR